MSTASRAAPFLLVAFSIALVLGSCGGEPALTIDVRRDRALDELLDRVIQPAMIALDDAARALVARLDELREAEGAEPALVAARASCVEAMLALRAAEPFVIGRSEELLLDRRLRGDAPDRDGLIALLDSDRLLDVGFWAALGTDRKGLATIELLLFDPTRPLDVRALELLAGLGRAFAADALALRELWRADVAGSDAASLRDPGQAERFATAGEAIDALVNRALMVVVRLRDRELAPLVGGTAGGVVQEAGPHYDPSGEKRRALIASYRALDRLYRGEDGAGLALIVVGANERIDAAIAESLREMITQLEAARDPLRENPKDRLTELYRQASLVKARFGVDLVAALDVTINFSLADGD